MTCKKSNLALSLIFMFLDPKVFLHSNVFLPQNVLAVPLSSYSHWFLFNLCIVLFFDFI